MAGRSWLSCSMICPRRFSTGWEKCPLPALQSMFDPLLPKGLQWYWRGDFVKELTNEAIEAHIAQAQKSPSTLSLVHLYPIDGAVRRVRQERHRLEHPRRDLVDGHRRYRSQSTKGGRNHALDQRLLGAVHPYSADGCYVDFMMDDGDDSRTQGHLRRQLRPPRRLEGQV